MNAKENPGTGATIHGASEAKARTDLFKQNTLHSASCQSAAKQRARIIQRLQHGPMTTLQARSMGIMHPGMRVCELRKQGFEIVTEWAFEYCPGGIRHRVARYFLLPTRQPTLFDLLAGIGEAR